MWDDYQPAKRPIVGELNVYEELDVRMNIKHLREVLPNDDPGRVAELLSGLYTLEPWIRVRMADDWFLTAGIEVTREDDQA